MNRESDIYVKIASYLSIAHPNVIFRFDFSAGTKMTMGQAMRHKSMNPLRGYPDLFIAEARGEYHGLYLEIKKEGESPYLKKGGGLRQNEHILEQAHVLSRLRKRGYKAEFAVGFAECFDMIEAYLKIK